MNFGMDTSNAASRLPETLFPLRPITVVVGHYGVGKTNLSLNLEAAGIRAINPVFAGSTLDVPSLSGELSTYLESMGTDHALADALIIDAGGDDAGATALGRFAKEIAARQHEVLYVVNAYRSLTQTPEEAAALLSEIEGKAGLKATGIVNNSHLQSETTEETIAGAAAFGEEVAKLCGLPLRATTVPLPALAAVRDAGAGPERTEPKSSVLFPSTRLQNTYVVQVYVHTPWEQ